MEAIGMYSKIFLSLLFLLFSTSSQATIKNIVVPPGTILAFAGTTCPTNTIEADGHELFRATGNYVKLFAAIGTTWGNGNGSTTFDLPDFRGALLRGKVGITSSTFTSVDVDTVTDYISNIFGSSVVNTNQAVRVSTSGTLPAPLAAATTYYTIYTAGSGYKLATTRANAIAGTGINLTTGGTGTHTIVQYVDPDSGTRTEQNVGGNTGDAVGSIQGDHSVVTTGTTLSAYVIYCIAY